MRVFTTDEQTLLRKIRDGAGRNLYSLIDDWIDGVSFQVNTETNSIDFIFEMRPDLDLIERVGQIQSIVIQSVNLIKLFEDKGYLFTFVNVNQLPPNPFSFGQAAINLPSVPYRFPDPRISKLFCEYSTREIFVTPELNKFISDGFITREEGRANRQWFTTRNALRVAIVALFLNIFFNIYNIFVKCSDNQKPASSNKYPTTANDNANITSDSTIETDTSVKTTLKTSSKIDTIKK